MNSFVFVAFFACLAAANAGVVVAPSAKIIQGPSSRTTIVGPDGSSISSVQPGGAIVHEDGAAIVADTAPVVAHAAPALAYSAAPALAYPAAYTAPLQYSAPFAYTAPLGYHAPLAYSSPLAYSTPLAYSAGVVAEKQLDTVVAGPSGTIATTKTINRPALVAAPQVYAGGLHAAYYL